MMKAGGDVIDDDEEDDDDDDDDDGVDDVDEQLKDINSLRSLYPTLSTGYFIRGTLYGVLYTGYFIHSLTIQPYNHTT